MAHVHDVAAYILDKRGPMTAMKLQKLCYYAYGYHLAWEERELFPERFEAWANGPVCYELYREHRGSYTLDRGAIPGHPDALDAGERDSVDLVLSGLGSMTAHELSAMTHREAPWLRARERGHAAPLERSNEELLPEEIHEFFDALIATAADGE